MIELLEEFMGISNETLLECLGQTVYMVAVSLLVGAVIGLILALVLVMTRPSGLLENKAVFFLFNTCINIIRSIPFIILIVAIMPLTKMIVGTRIGTKAAMVPLIIHSGPYMARLFESSMLEVDHGIIEASQSMGATIPQIIWHFLLPESLPSLVLAIATGSIGLLGSSAMAGTVGGGGVGNLAISYGYQRFNNNLMFVTVVILVILVQLLQTVGNRVSHRLRHAENET